MPNQFLNAILNPVGFVRDKSSFGKKDETVTAYA